MSSSQRWLQRLAVPALVLLVAIAFGNALQNDFCFDDRPFIEKSEDIHDIGNVPGMFGIGGKMAYRPVRQASYALDIWLWGGKDAFGFHLTNVILHALTTIVLFFLARRLLGNPLAAWITAALFALHPIHTESVTYISGRKDVLCTLFGLLAVHAFLAAKERFQRGDKALAALPALAVGAFLLLSIGSKEMGFAFIPLLALVHFLPKLRDEARGHRALDVASAGGRLALRYWKVLGALSALGVVLVILAFDSRATHQEWHGGTAIHNFLTVARVQVLYLFRMFFPLRLVGDYHYDSFRVTESVLDPTSWVALLGVLGLVAIAIALTRRHYFVALGSLWYFVAMLPVSHIRPHHELLAERYLYLPSVGFCIALAAVAMKLVQSDRMRRPATVALALVLSLYGTRTMLRNLDWSDDRTFWSVTREQKPRNARAHIFYAYNLYYDGRVREAIAAMEEGLAIQPEFYSGNYNMARMYETHGEPTRAIEHYKLEITRYRNEDAYFNLANLLGRLGRFEEAEEVFEKLVDNFKPTPEALCLLGIVRERLGDLDGARHAHRRALARDAEYRKSIEALRRLGTSASRESPD